MNACAAILSALLLAAGAPAILPEFLQPSIPTKSNATWRNAEQRAADKAAKAARVAGLPPPAPPVRWLRVPQAGEGAAAAAVPAILPAVLLPGQQERQLTGMEMWLPDIPAAALAGPLGGLRSPQKRAPGPWGLPGSGGGKKQRLEAAPALDEDGNPLQAAPSHYKAAPHSQEARDAKSGKGRKRLFLHPIIRTKDRCGKCSVHGRCYCCLQSGRQSMEAVERIASLTFPVAGACLLRVLAGHLALAQTFLLSLPAQLPPAGLPESSLEESLPHTPRRVGGGRNGGRAGCRGCVAQHWLAGRCGAQPT
jgi:hypothetical protein